MSAWVKRVGVGLVLWSLLMPSATAGRVALHRRTGALLEYQSHARPGTVTDNAIRRGIALEDIEEREVTDAEWAALWEALVVAPARAERAQRQAERSAKATALRAKLGLSAAEWADLQEALRE